MESHSHSSLRTRVAVSAAALVLGALAGCTPKSPEQPPGIDLLRRSPDLLISQPGVLSPTSDEIWGRFSTEGWKTSLQERDGASIAWAEVPRVRFKLPMILPQDADVRIGWVLPGVRGTEGIEAEVLLNDEPLGTKRIETGLSHAELRAPADLWVRGDNVLEIRVAEMTETEDLGEVSFGVTKIEYSEPRTAHSKPGELALSGGTSGVYRLEHTGQSLLVVEGAADGRGSIEVRTRIVAAETGTTVRELDPVRSEASEKLFLRVPLPDPTGDLIEAEVVWLGEEATSTCKLKRLFVHETVPFERVPVIFISVDTLAAQNLSLYGYARKTSPHLETFAKDAVVFDACRANAPWTVPSYMSQFTGLLPRSHQMAAKASHKKAKWEKEQIAPSRWTMAESLRATGYRTAGFVDNPWLARDFGFTQGFDHYDVAAAEIGPIDPDGGIELVARNAIEWLDDQKDGVPPFLFVQCFDTHSPYVPEEPWDGSFDGDGVLPDEWILPVGEDQSFAYDCIRPHTAWHQIGNKSQHGGTANATLVANAYDEKILQVDAVLGDFFTKLKERGLYDRSVIVFSADHGEAIQRHGFHFGHSLLFNDVLHVPLLIKLPGSKNGGTRISEPVQLIDLYPTILELATGLKPRNFIHGRSLAPLFDGREIAPLPTLGEGGIVPGQSVEWEGWKLIVTRPGAAPMQMQVTHPRLDKERLARVAPEIAGKWLPEQELAAHRRKNRKFRAFLQEQLGEPIYELYYLPDDPFELNDVAAEHPDKVADLKALIDEGIALGEHARSRASFQSTSVILSKEDLEEFRALGYAAD